MSDSVGGSDNKPNPHTVTVTTRLDDEGTEDEIREVDTVKFTCTAPPDAECRNYPENCGCESWSWDEGALNDQDGHPRVAGQQCWMTDWFDVGDGAVAYCGADYDDRRDDCVPAVDRTGAIKVMFRLEYIEWEFCDV